MSPTQIYLQYLQQLGLTLAPPWLEQVEQSLAETNWDDPQTLLDYHNIGILALLEAEQTDLPEMRGLYWETALAAFQQGSAGYPLSTAHLALMYALLQDPETTFQLALPGLLQTVATSEATTGTPWGLVYLPRSLTMELPETLQRLLNAAQGQEQAHLLAAIALGESQTVFYNAIGQRFLKIAAPLFPESVSLHLRQGIAEILAQQWEGLLHLHQAERLQPHHPQTLLALHLAYRDLGQPEQAQHWYEQWSEQAQAIGTGWATVAAQVTPQSNLVPLAWESGWLMAEASFQSLVTSVLLGAGDWFEAEMEFWRNSIQPGMTVIDVGANVGVYSLSAAQRVGAQGRVFAIEPFSGCVQALNASKQVNQWSQLTICHGAASDRLGQSKLLLQSASELNELVEEEQDLPPGSYEEVNCFTLDSLIDSYDIDRVDFLKIDAEGHEVPVLKGSDRILREFKPVILYENIAGGQGSNLAVAEWLLQHQYRLYCYQPFVQQLVAIDTLEDIHGNLNIIAISAS
ncbi:MAG: FkbM family methyltransferase [Synechococcales bacterium]|nr:FkbM family methyltransferase [Synechococcales bacterium]